MIKAKKYIHYYKTQADFERNYSGQTSYYEPWLSGTIIPEGTSESDTPLRTDYNKNSN